MKLSIALIVTVIAEESEVGSEVDLEVARFTNQYNDYQATNSNEADNTNVAANSDVAADTDDYIVASINDLSASRYEGDEYDVALDSDVALNSEELGNKKKNKGQKNQQINSYAPSYANKKPNYNEAQAAWSNQVNTPDPYFGYGKGYEFDQDLVGNGRFCWNCFSRTGYGQSAYENCFDDVYGGYMETCVGEEYYCEWEERRGEHGRVEAVSGGCKSAHSCLRQMTENFRWTVHDPKYPILSANLCTSGNFGDQTKPSTCAWCCDGMPNNLDRFAPEVTHLCNHKAYVNGPAESPAYHYDIYYNTDNFVWNDFSVDPATGYITGINLFNHLYTDGQFHGLFRIHDNYPLGGGSSQEISAGHYENGRLHARGSYGEIPFKGQ